MTQDEIIRIAEMCGIPEFENNESQAKGILQFATLVAEAEREELMRIDWQSLFRHGGLVTWGDAEEFKDRVIAAIRAAQD